MLDNVYVFKQSSIKIARDKVIYFDPFEIEEEFHDADLIFITHSHYDHYDVESIKKVMNSSSTIIVPKSMYLDVIKDFNEGIIYQVEPLMEYEVKQVKFTTVRSYNNDKSFHPKDNNWLGYNVLIDNNYYFVMGDSDDTVDARSVSCDVLFVPIGGTYTMDKEEAVNFTNYLKPKVAVPIHYGSIVGNKEDGVYFVTHLDSNIQGKVLIE